MSQRHPRGIKTAKQQRRETLLGRLEECCDTLIEFHLHHTEDMVTRFRVQNCTCGKEHPTVYIASDPEWRDKIDALIDPIMSKEPGEKLPHVGGDEPGSVQ